MAPEVNRINSYRLYVPTTWTTQGEKKMVVCLHGAGGHKDTVFDRAQGRLSYYAEKFGYLLLAPNSLVAYSNYGGATPPSGMSWPNSAWTRERFFSWVTPWAASGPSTWDRSMICSGR